MTSQRHRWGEPVRFAHKTERECARCGLIKVTRHEAVGAHDVHFTEWWQGLDKINSAVTPSCDARHEAARAAA